VCSSDLATWFSFVPVVTEPVPSKLAGFPQYQAGTWSYVKGFKPI